MQIKYYSEVLGKYFDEEKELVKAEKAYIRTQEEAKKRKEMLASTRKERAQEVEEAFKKANDLLEEFINDYRSFHFSMTREFGLGNRFCRRFFNFQF